MGSSARYRNPFEISLYWVSIAFFELRDLSTSLAKALETALGAETSPLSCNRLWKKRNEDHAKLTALILHSNRKFVFLLDKTSAPTVRKCLKAHSHEDRLVLPEMDYHKP